MGIVEQARLIRSELSDDILISAVIAIALVDIWRNILITAEWLKSRIERREEESAKAASRATMKDAQRDAKKAEPRDVEEGP